MGRRRGPAACGCCDRRNHTAKLHAPLPIVVLIDSLNAGVSTARATHFVPMARLGAFIQNCSPDRSRIGIRRHTGHDLYRLGHSTRIESSKTSAAGYDAVARSRR
jgi:hypothetical protein